MAEKTLKGRIVQKHDIEANWLLATGFTPKQGEIIVYDIDDTHSYERIKIGDGVQNVNDLPFADDALKETLTTQINDVDGKVDTVSALVGDVSVSEQIDTALLESQPDWNQNDESAVDYVKNRTHYSEMVEEVLVEETTVDFTSSSMYRARGTFPKWVTGEKARVVWDGMIYDCAVTANTTGYPIIGALNEYDSDKPFGIRGTVSMMIIMPSTYETHTFSISKLVENVHKLDEKYLPDTLVTAVETAQTTANNKMDATNPVGTGSFSMNRKADTTIGSCSVAEGNNTEASGGNSHAEGWNTIASGHSSHAEGRTNIASGDGSHAEGGTMFSSGGPTTASGEASHAEGAGTTASGLMSHAEGRKTNASGNYSHAEGDITTASGEASHAEGDKTTASGRYSHAEGSYTTAQRKSQHVEGEYNILDTEGTTTTSRGKYAHIVGNGIAITARSNAHTLDWNGIGWFQGGLQVGGNAQDNGAKNVMLEGVAQHFFILTDDITSYEYIIRMRNGNLTSTCKASSIAVTTLPTKVSYAVGETLDLADMVVTITRQDGSTEETNNYTYTEPDLSSAGTKNVTVSYVEAGETYTTTFSVTVA